MEVKRVDANTLQVNINKDELAARGIGLMDLMGDQQQLEDFFQGVLEEVDPEHQFAVDRTVLFQAMPTREGIRLLITKRDPNASDAQVQEQLSSYLQNELRGYDQPQEEKSGGQPAADPIETALNTGHGGRYTQVVRFDQFEDFVTLAKSLETTSMRSDLYKEGDYYYGVLTFVNNGDITPAGVRDRLAMVYEYGQPSNLTAELLAEHGQRIMEQAAFELARHYFEK